MTGAPSTIRSHYAALTKRIKIGYAVAVPGFADRLAGELKLPVEVAVVAADSLEALGNANPGLLTVAAGLAVEER